MKRRQQSGFSLISVLVGLLIGIFVVSGAASIYVDSEMSSMYHDAMAAMHDNARYAIQDLQDTVILTGRKVSPKDTVFGSFRNDSRSDIITSAAVINRDGAGGASDTLVISYAAGQECGIQREIDDGDKNNEDILAFEITVNNNFELQCTAHGYDAADPDYVRTLIGGVRNMQVLYGVDTDADGSANRYANATNVETDDAWEDVVSVRIGLLVSSGEFKVGAIDKSRSDKDYQVLDETITVNAGDNQLYRVYSTTIALRNLIGLSRQAGI
jgi:type IV pilus assembly protein PilW